MTLLKEHQYLLMRRESRVVIGHNAVNLWLLVAVLLATFLAIAFSAGSMSYLEEKMKDPFTNWVNINLHNGKNLDEFRDSLESKSMKQHFGFKGYQREVQSSFNCWYKDEDNYQVFSTLFYEQMRSDFIVAVLGKKNVIDNMFIDPDSIADNSVGVITTLETLERLGYDRDHVPAFIDFYASSPGADEYGISVTEDGYARAPMPLLGVVKRLPMNRDVIASRYLDRQTSNTNHPFALNKKDYFSNIYYFVPAEVSDFTQEYILSLLDDSLRCYIKCIGLGSDTYQGMLRSWKKGKVWKVYLNDPVPVNAFKRIADLLTENYAKQGVVRVFNYETTSVEAWNSSKENSSSQMDDIVSVNFVTFDSIRPFERFVRNVTELQIEMTQVNNRENFNEVRKMANILIVALLLFSMVSIIIFIVNMMQSYFQKVKRNLGTFKAFGMSTRELMRVYVVIIVGIVVSALAIALAVTWAVEGVLLLFNVVKEGGGEHLILWEDKTLFAIVIILVSTVVSVLVVMQRLLRQTPGDLIYDR